MEKMIRAAVKEPGGRWKERHVEDRLENWQEIVGGYIEGFYVIADGILLFCNEDGKSLDLKPNVLTPSGDMVVGTIFAVRYDDEGEFVSLRDEDLVRLDADREER